MRKFEEKTASWSRHRRQTLLVRLVSLTLCFALFVSSTGMALIGEGEQQDASADADIMATDVVPDGDTGDGTDTGASDDALPGDTGDGSDAGDIGSGDGSGMGEISGGDTGEPVDPGAGENPPVDNTAEIAAALERFNAALDAFRADYTYELSNHGIDGHVCRWTQFEMALNLATAVKTSVSELIANDAAVLSGLDETNAMLSVCAAGAYESRAAAVLARTDYTGMTQFDADVARVDSLLKYMLDAELNSGVITGLRADLTQMRVDLAAALESGSGSGSGDTGDTDPDTPENPDQPEQPVNPDDAAIIEIAAAYEALNAGWQSMSFDAALAEIGRIQAMIGGLSDTGKADINIVAISEYLLTIQSAAAVQELGARVAALQAESLDALGLADRISDAKALVGYMTAADAVSDAVTGHLAALDAILGALNAPVVSDTGKKFVADVAALKGVFDASRLHAMSKQVVVLREAYGLLVETDKTDASVIAALAELDVLQSACDGLDSNIKAFLTACDALFEVYAQPGFDIESESAQALARSVADAFALLNESSFDNVEVVEYYTRLEAAGLLPKDDIAAQIDFQVKMDRLENTSAVEAYSAGMGSKIQVFRLEHNSSANMGAGDVEYSDDYFRSYAILGLDAQDVNGTALGLDFNITATGETDRVNGNYIQQVYASTKSYDEIDALVNQIAQTDFATATYTMADLLAEHFVEVADGEAAPAGARCYIVAYDVDAQGANVSARCDISVNIGGGDWTTVAPGTSVGYKFRGVTEPGNRVADSEDVDGIGLWQYSRVGGVEGDGVFVDDAVLNNGTVRLVARELSGTLSDENGVGMGDIALALFTYDSSTDAYTRLERDISGNRLADVLSADDGSYLFDKLPAGDYYIAMRGSSLNNKAAGAGMIKVTDRMHGLDGWTFVSEGAVSFKTLQQFNTDILLGSSEYVQTHEWSGQFEAGLPPYEVFVTWMDGQPGATLSEDKTHADWVVSDQASLEGVAKSFEIEIIVNEDIPAGTKLLEVPRLLLEQPVDFTRYGWRQTDGVTYTFDYWLRESSVSGALSATSYFAYQSGAIVTSELAPSGSRVKLSLNDAVFYNLNPSNRDSAFIKTSMDFDGEQLFVFKDGDNVAHKLTFTRSAVLGDVDVDVFVKSDTDSHKLTKNKGSRVWSWSPNLETYYGVTKEQFDAAVTDDKVVLEFSYKTIFSGWGLGFVDYEFVPSDAGVVLGQGFFDTFYVAGMSYNEAFKFTDASKIPYPYPFDAGGFTVDALAGIVSTCFTRVSRGQYRATDVNSKLHTSVLVVYSSDAIYDADTDTVTASCRCKATFHPAFGSGELTGEVESVKSAPFTYIPSDGSAYSISSIMARPTMWDSVGSLIMGNDVSLYCCLNADYAPYSSELNNAELVWDSFGVYSYDGKQVFSLNSDDYFLSDLFINDFDVGQVYYNDSGAISSYLHDEQYNEDVVKVYVCTADSPDVWLYDSEYTVRALHTASSRLYFAHDNVTRCKLVYENRQAFLHVTANAYVEFRSNSPRIKSLVEEMRSAIVSGKNFSNLRFTFSGALLAYLDGGRLLAANPQNSVTGAWADSLNAVSDMLYVNEGYGNSGHPVRTVGTTYLASTDGDYAAALQCLFNADDTEMTVQVASYLNLPNGKDVFPSGSSLANMHTAEYLVLLPESVEVVSVLPGLLESSNTGTNSWVHMNYRYAGISGSLHKDFLLTSEYDSEPQIEFEVDAAASVPGYTAYRVLSTFVFDRTVDPVSAYGSEMPYGHFRLICRPKYTEQFTNDDTYVTVISRLIDPETGNSYKDPLLFKMRQDGGYNFAHLPDDAGYKYLWDMDKNGDTSEKILATISMHWPKSTSSAYVSGLQLKAQGSSSRLFNTAATTSPTDPYCYKMTYQQAIEPSTNVVMYNSIEDISGNTWGGVLSDIDMSDADRQNIAYTIYGNRSRIDSLNYVQSKFNHENLRALEDGWFVIDNNTDLSTVKSIAIDFGSHEFQRDENNKPATVSVVYSMTPPSNGFAAGQTSIGNRAFFSDTLKGSGVTRTVMANQVTVTMDTEVGGGISKTIVPVIRQGASGDISGDGMLTSVAESGNGSQTGGDVWVDTYDETGNKITLDKTGKPANPYQYQYHLKYTMDDPGAGSYNSVRNVILYDNLENGTDSKYAGRLTDISVTGVDAFFAELGQGHAPSGGGSGNEEPVGGGGDDAEFLAMPFSLLPDNSGVSYTGLAGADVYVNYDGMSVSTNLPDGLVDATGIQDWTLLGSLSDGNVLPAPEGANIRHVAVVVPDLTTMHESGLNATPYQDSYIDVALTMEHAGRTDCFGNDKIIRNNMLVSYQVPGVDDPVVMGLPSEQEPELEVIYRDAGFALPVTGGSGWFIPTVSGIGCIVLAASWILSERKWRRRMAAVMAQQSQSGSDNQ